MLFSGDPVQQPQQFTHLIWSGGIADDDSVFSSFGFDGDRISKLIRHGWVAGEIVRQSIEVHIIKQVHQGLTLLLGQVSRLEERIAVLERIATEEGGKAAQLADQIDRLR